MMTNLDRKCLVSLDRKAAVLRKVWLREREEQRTMQIAANANVRRRWIELTSPESEAISAAEHGIGIDYDSENSSG
jgi:hypothetical protein